MEEENWGGGRQRSLLEAPDISPQMGPGGSRSAEEGKGKRRVTLRTTPGILTNPTRLKIFYKYLGEIQSYL